MADISLMTRNDFPILKKAVYLDSAATSLCPEPVLEKTLEYYREFKANIHRGSHSLTERASREYESVYRKLARFFNAKPNSFIHTKNASEAINLVALGLEWGKGANVVTTVVEHHSNLLPWMRLKDRKIISELRFVEPLDAEGGFDIDDFKEQIDSDTRLVAVTGASNVLGNRVRVVQEIIKAAHAEGALVLLDAAQMVGIMPVDFKRLGVDFAAFSGHKMLAPMGTGCLYHNVKGFQSPLLGGGMIKSVSREKYVLMPSPQGGEAGTPNISGVIGLGAAVDYLSKAGLKRIEAHEQELAGMMIDGLRDLPGVEVYGPLDSREKTGLVSFNLKGIPTHEVAIMADELARVCIRSGHHCAMPLHEFLGVAGSVRASVHCYNNEADVETFLGVVRRINALK